MCLTPQLNRTARFLPDYYCSPRTDKSQVESGNMTHGDYVISYFEICNMQNAKNATLDWLVLAKMLAVKYLHVH